MKTLERSTPFLPPDRTSPEGIEKAFNSISAHPLLTQLLDAMPIICLLLNQKRQIIFANKATAEFMKLEDRRDLAGLRPGEALQCVYAFEQDGGCGTTPYCRMCGAAQMLADEHRWYQDGHECRILRSNGTEALDLRVSAVPVCVDQKTFIVFTMTDISHEKRRNALERIFFHDILNTAGAIRGLSELLVDRQKDSSKRHLELIGQLSHRLIEEIQGQRQLRAAENNELVVRPRAIRTDRFLKEIKLQYEAQPYAKGRGIDIAPETESFIVGSDPVLLGRVLGNLVKNALEASREGDSVLMGADAQDETVEFWVQSSEPMTPEVQLQVFQRSFSTKGSGRGLGTFGVKLITEKYLKGAVSFQSSPENGTVFRISVPRDLAD